jgi:hypothetical protein
MVAALRKDGPGLCHQVVTCGQNFTSPAPDCFLVQRLEIAPVIASVDSLRSLLPPTCCDSLHNSRKLGEVKVVQWHSLLMTLPSAQAPGRNRNCQYEREGLEVNKIRAYTCVAAAVLAETVRLTEGRKLLERERAEGKGRNSNGEGDDW